MNTRSNARNFLMLTLFMVAVPLPAATLVVDFDAAKGILPGAGSAVATWSDQVTGSNDATPVSAGQAPILETDIFAGGQPGVRFDGVNDQLRFSASGFPKNHDPYTLVAVWKASSFQTQDSFARPTIGGYGPDGVNHQDGAFLAVRPDANTSHTNGVAIHRTNGSDQNFGAVPPAATGAMPVLSNTPYVHIVSKTSSTTVEGTLVGPSGTTSGTDEGIDSDMSSVTLGTGWMGNVLQTQNGDFNQSVFNGWVGRFQVWEGALSGAELQALINEMNVYVSGGTPPAAPTAFAWDTDSSGAWTQNSNWTEYAYAPPNNPNHTATFGDAITADRMIYTEEPVTVNRIEFANVSASYFIAGTRGINLAATTADPAENPSISVAGSHEFQAAVGIHNDTTIDIASASTLTFNNALNLNGHAITKTGSGELSVNNLLNSGGGSLEVLEGTVSGNGAVGGNVVNNGGTISPGNSSQASGVPEPTCLGLLLLGLLCIGTAIGRRPS